MKLRIVCEYEVRDLEGHPSGHALGVFDEFGICQYTADTLEEIRDMAEAMFDGYTIAEAEFVDVIGN
jgi:hypothetical protein